jgi:hypothetical protein
MFFNDLKQFIVIVESNLSITKLKKCKKLIFN